MKEETASKGGNGPSQQHIREYIDDDKKAVSAILSRSFNESVGDETLWTWKHENRPGFSSSQIAIATADDKLIACFHGAILPIKLEGNLTVPFSFDGDFAVLPEYRGSDLGIQLHDYTHKIIYDSGAVLRGGFTSKELNKRFYRKQFGYEFIPTVTTNYRKVIGLNLLRNKVESLGKKLLSDASLKNALSKKPLLINFQITDFPEFHLSLTHESFALVENLDNQATVHLSMPYKVLMAMSLGTKALAKEVLKAIFSGNFRIRKFRGIPASMFVLVGAVLRARREP